MADTTQTVQENDVGVVFRITVTDVAGTALDISTATSLQILFEGPDGTILAKTAAFTNSGTDGQLQYSTIAGDLNQTGTWQIQAKVITPTFATHSAVTKFKVKANIA